MNLSWADLTSAEQSFVVFLTSHGSVRVPSGTVVRANIVAQFLTGQGSLSSASPHRRRLQIENVVIDGSLDLADTRVRLPTLFRDCYFRDEVVSVDVSRSTVADIRFESCFMAGMFRGDLSRIDSNMHLRDVVVEGGFFLQFASVEGSLTINDVLSGGQSSGPCTLDGIRVEGLFQIGDSEFLRGLNARESRFASQSYVSWVTVGDDQTPEYSVMNFSNSHFGSEVRFGPNIATESLALNGLRCDANVILDSVRAGTDRPNSAQLSLSEIRGGLRIQDCEFDGQLRVDGATAYQIELLHLSVGMRPSHDQRKHDLPDVIVLDGTRLAGDLDVGYDNALFGQVHAIGMTIGGQVKLEQSEADQLPLFLNLEDTQISGVLFLDEVNPGSTINLTLARLGGIYLDPHEVPQVNLLRARVGFLSDRTGRHLGPEGVIKMVESPHWQTPLSVYGDMANLALAGGDLDGYRTLNIHGQSRLYGRGSRARRVVGFAYKHSVGFGYAPSRAVVVFAALLAIGSGLFGLMHGGGLDLSPEPVAFVHSSDDSPGTFNPVLYALSSLVPGGNYLAFGWMPKSLAAQSLSVIFQLLGWILATFIIAGLASRARSR